MRVMLMSVLFFVFATTVYAEIPPKPDAHTSIYDYSNVIDDAAEEEMRALIEKIEVETSNEVVIMTLDTLGGIDMLQFGQQVMRDWEIGGEDDRGMLMFATAGQDEGNNAVWISVGSGIEESFYEPEIERIIDEYMIEALADGDYTTAFYDTLSIIGQEMLGEIEDADPYEDDEMFWWIVGGLFLLFMLWVLFYLGPKYGTGSSDSSYDYESGGGSSDSGYGGGSSDGGGSGRSF